MTDTYDQARAPRGVDCPAVIRWCADRVRTVDDDAAVQDAADYLDDLAAGAKLAAADRVAVIRWCALQIHSMGGEYAVERAADYLDDLATETVETT